MKAGAITLDVVCILVLLCTKYIEEIIVLLFGSLRSGDYVYPTTCKNSLQQNKSSTYSESSFRQKCCPVAERGVGSTEFLISTRDENSWICKQRRLDEVAHNEPPHQNLHCLSSSLWILIMIKLELNIFWKVADENFVDCNLVIKELKSTQCIHLDTRESSSSVLIWLAQE